MANQQGWSQQTPAVQSMLGGAMRAVRSTARKAVRRVKRAVKRRASARGAKRSASSSARGKRPARLVKGSAAAKAYMAKIRKMRKK